MNVIAFPPHARRHRCRPDVFIQLDSRGNGLWEVNLVSYSGDSAALLGRFPSLAAAQRAAQIAAKQYDAALPADYFE